MRASPAGQGTLKRLNSAFSARVSFKRKRLKEKRKKLLQSEIKRVKCAPLQS
jgi:hypothetical protein